MIKESLSMVLNNSVLNSKINPNPIYVGDLVTQYGVNTKPGVVTDIADDGEVSIDTDIDLVEKYHKYANTSGLTLDDKVLFNAIMDDIADDQSLSPADKVSVLQMKIDDLSTDPDKRAVTNTLKGEQAIFIRTARALPRVYVLPESKVPRYGADKPVS
jgi:hypothetical protein